MTSLKSDIGELVIDKLKTAPTDLIKLCSVDNDVAKRLYDKLIKNSMLLMLRY